MKYSLRSQMTFSIRDLFWLTVVVALAVAWFVERRRSAADLSVEQQRLAAELSKEREFRSGLHQLPNLFPQYKRVWGESPNVPAFPAMPARFGEPNSSAPAPNPPKK